VAALWGSVPIPFGEMAGWAGFGLWAETTPWPISELGYVSNFCKFIQINSTNS
jgi:hypothetical protein